MKKTAFICSGLLATSGLLAGCIVLPAEQVTPSIFERPVFTGVSQVVDPQSGELLFVPCNPCALPTSKTPVVPAFTPSPIAQAEPAKSAVSFLREPSVNASVPVATLSLPVPLVAPAEPHISSVPVPVASMPATAPAGISAADEQLQPAHLSVSFASSQKRLKPDSREAIASFASAASGAKFFYIRGRADASGSQSKNKTLALARAQSVRSAFIAAGVPASKLKVSFCASCFAAPNDTALNRSANRRVDVEAVYPS